MKQPAGHVQNSYEGRVQTGTLSVVWRSLPSGKGICDTVKPVWCHKAYFWVTKQQCPASPMVWPTLTWSPPSLEGQFLPACRTGYHRRADQRKKMQKVTWVPLWRVRSCTFSSSRSHRSRSSPHTCAGPALAPRGEDHPHFISIIPTISKVSDHLCFFMSSCKSLPVYFGSHFFSMNRSSEELNLT